MLGFRTERELTKAPYIPAAPPSFCGLVKSAIQQLLIAENRQRIVILAEELDDQLYSTEERRRDQSVAYDRTKGAMEKLRQVASLLEAAP